MKLIDLFNEDLTVKGDVFNKVFPEMSTCHHSLRWHMEGSIANHSSLVYDEMRKRIKDVQREDYDECSEIIMQPVLNISPLTSLSSTLSVNPAAYGGSRSTSENRFFPAASLSRSKKQSAQ